MQATNVKNMAEEVQNSLAGFWNDARLNSVTSALIQHYFPLTVRLRFGWTAPSAWVLTPASRGNLSATCFHGQI